MTYKSCRPDEMFEFKGRCKCTKENIHECAHCFETYCDCTEKAWAVGADGITYCSKWCAVQADQEVWNEIARREDQVT